LNAYTRVTPADATLEAPSTPPLHPSSIIAAVRVVQVTSGGVLEEAPAAMVGHRQYKKYGD
jgi:hypothetical protein